MSDAQIIGVIFGFCVVFFAGYCLGQWHEFRMWFDATDRRKNR